MAYVNTMKILICKMIKKNLFVYMYKNIHTYIHKLIQSEIMHIFVKVILI